MKYFFTFISFITIFSLIAQNRERDPLLDRVIEKYSQSASAKMDFDLTIQQAEQAAESFTGTFARKGEQYHMTSELQTVYSNGDAVWVYIPENEEVQILDAEENTSLPTPQNMVDRFYNEEYKMRSGMTAKKGEKLYEFVPEDADEEIYKIQVLLDTDAEIINSIKAYDRNGDRYVMALSNQNFNIALSDELFNFDADKHPGVYIEDLRID